jgi:hypothetical protein
MKSLKVIFIFAYINIIHARDPRGTPLDELLRKQNTVCKSVDAKLINEARVSTKILDLNTINFF